MIYNKPQRKKGETWVLNEKPDWLDFALNVAGTDSGWNTVQTKFVSNGVTFDGISILSY